MLWVLKEPTWQDSSHMFTQWPLSKRLKIGFQDPLSLNAGQKYCRMLQQLLAF